MKKMCFHHDCFVPSHALEHMMYGSMLLVSMTKKCSTSQAIEGRHVVHNVFMIIYIYVYIYICILCIYIYIYIYICLDPP